MGHSADSGLWRVSLRRGSVTREAEMQQRALVTGAGARLGRAMALCLAQREFDVAIHYATSKEGAEEVAEEVRALGRKAELVQADLLDLDQAEPLVDRAAELLGGPLNGLINNASIFEYDTIETATRESWDRHMLTNLRVPFILTQAFAKQAPKCTKDRDGQLIARSIVVNMVDQRVKKLTPEFMTYSLAKHGLWTLTQTAAQALAPDIRVNAIGPGTTLRGHRQSQEHFEGQRSKSLLQRGPNVSDVTAALGYYLDAPAVTGQLICVDGGQHLTWQTRDVQGVE
ncbi:SDR family oxidoreductase [Halocynthiibacter sp. C4]|uniref:SDR family oxidoreductase n=1 Tax=Halocynthiibacter sp. C4 TaxID=2992758 RepID=UPI00237A24F1|nr:SDR family oxidoreductase [Halocynthiibacter sp. C4]MDE0590847.1 SDR family oxidoreductase [Halocynthiibacter sp. C4]